MKKIRFKTPYKKNGKTNFPGSRKRSGVYLIKENGKLVYIGSSGGNVYKTLYRHFQQWYDRRGPRVTYANRMKRPRYRYTVRIVYAPAKKAARLERALILKHSPRDNKDKFQNYTMDFHDQKAIEEYKNAPTVCPF